LLFLCLIAAPAWADDPYASEIVVSATRTPRPAGEVGSSVAVIDADAIARAQHPFVADALRAVAGVSLARNGAFGGVATARIRGGAGGQTLVVVDGVVVNDAAAPQGGFNFANLDVADVARIEVLKGPQGIVYGADAAAGVVSIITRNSSDHRISVFAEGGSLATARAGATVFFGDAANYARATVSGVRTDGVSRAAIGTEADGFRQIAGSLSAGAGLGASWKAELTARASRSRAAIDGFPPPAFALGDTAETERTSERAVSARALHDHGRVAGALSLSYQNTDRRNTDAGAQTFAAKGARWSADYLAEIALAPAARLVAGAAAGRIEAVVSGVDDARGTGAVFALGEWTPRPGLALSAGVRRDEFSDFAGATTARVAGAYSPAEFVTLRASWGEGYRAPTLFELNFDQFGVVPNPNLEPERTRGFDAGAELRFGGRGRLRATYFELSTRDLIGFELAQSGYFNIDRARSRGVELDGEIDLGARASLSLAYAHVDAIDVATGARLPRIPKHSGTIAARAAPLDGLELSLSLFLNGRESDVPAPNAAFARLDLRAALRLSDAVELYGRVENATDADYQDVSGFGEPGRTAFTGVRVRL
jgi:vitamin B12 transporter